MTDTLAPDDIDPGALAGAAFTEAANTGDYEPNVENPDNDAETLTDEQKTEANQAVAEVLSEDEIEATKSFLDGLPEDRRQLLNISIGLDDQEPAPKLKRREKRKEKTELKEIEKMKRGAKLEKGSYDNQRIREEKFTIGFNELVRLQAEERLKLKVEQGDPAAIEAQKIVTAARAAELVAATADSLSASVLTRTDSPENKSLDQTSDIENRYVSAMARYSESLQTLQAGVISAELGINLDDTVDEAQYGEVLDQSRVSVMAGLMVVQESIINRLVDKEAIKVGSEEEASWQISQVVLGVIGAVERQDLRFKKDASGNNPKLKNVVSIVPDLVYADGKDLHGGKRAGLFYASQNMFKTIHGANKYDELKVRPRAELSEEMLSYCFNAQRAEQARPIVEQLNSLPLLDQVAALETAIDVMAVAELREALKAKAMQEAKPDKLDVKNKDQVALLEAALKAKAAEDGAAKPDKLDFKNKDQMAMLEGALKLKAIQEAVPEEVDFSNERHFALFRSARKSLEVTPGEPKVMLGNVLKRVILSVKGRHPSRYEPAPGGSINASIRETNDYQRQEEKVLAALKQSTSRYLPSGQP